LAAQSGVTPFDQSRFVIRVLSVKHASSPNKQAELSYARIVPMLG
jgi:hypothetical protein